MKQADTIAAQATSPGLGGVGVIRISGPKALAIAKELLGIEPKARYAHFAAFRDAGQAAIDQGLALYFPAPNSFTGEDVLELQGHGGAVIMDCLLQRVLELGARMANPGEFSERAFLNGKIDLAQAESIADLINAASTQAAKCAMRSLQGEFSAQINVLVEQLVRLRTYVEAAIDFSTEEIGYISTEKMAQELTQLTENLVKIQANASQGALLREGISVVIVGKPNVGKSSLLNYFSGYDAAIVTDIPGTTRDVVKERLNIKGVPLHIIDTAGLRESFDLVEQKGIEKTWQEMAKADFILLITDTDAVDLHAFKDVTAKIIVVRNKIDLVGEKARHEANKLYVSVKTGAGMELLQQHLLQQVGFEAGSGANFMARRRHLTALEQAGQHLSAAKQHFETNSAFELLAEELRQMHHALGEITGEFYSDDLLGKIFSEFCIGK